MMSQILDEIRQERAAQDALWGGPAHDDEHSPEEWLSFIQDYHDRAHRQVKRARLSGEDEGFRDTLVKIAALAVAACECIDRKKQE